VAYGGRVRVLVIGGTQFVGRAIAVAALGRGHQVTTFHRGVSEPGGIPGADSVLGDRDLDLSGLGSGEWDATVDVTAYRPGQVDSLADALGGRGGRHALISTVSVYAADIAPGGDESSPLTSLAPLEGLDPATCPIDDATYGPLKVLCEARAGERHGDLLVIRPTYVVGPRDVTMRFPTWVRRLADGGAVEVPLPRESSMQHIDARDQAEFVVDLLERGVTGTFTSASPPTTFGAMVDDVAAAVGAADLELRWVTPDPALAEAGAFPLWAGPEPAGQLQLDPAAALAQGLSPRSLRATARDTLAWLREA